MIFFNLRGRKTSKLFRKESKIWNKECLDLKKERETVFLTKVYDNNFDRVLNIHLHLTKDFVLYL